MNTPATSLRRGESPRRQAERLVAQLNYADVLAIEARIEAGGDPAGILAEYRAGFRLPSAPAVHALALLRGMVMARLAQFTAEHGPWTGPLRMPIEVDFGQVDMWLYVWDAILYGVALAQNAVDGNPSAPGRPIPAEFSLWDAQLPEFWHGDRGDREEPIGDWPTVTSAQSCLGIGAGAA